MTINFSKKQYEQKILPIIKSFEKTQKRARKKFLITIFIGTLLAIISIVPVFISDELAIGSGLFGFCFVICIMITFEIATTIHANFIDKLKKELSDKIIQEYGIINLKQLNKNIDIITNEELHQSKLFNEYGTNKPDDRFEGTYNDVYFRVLETKETINPFENRNGDFIGIIIAFNFNKNFKGKTIIKSKKIPTPINMEYVGNLILVITILAASTIMIIQYNMNPLATILIALGFMILIYTLGKKSDTKKKEEILNKATLEYNQFNKQYNTYMEDEIEGRYLITPSFMERFYNLKTAFGTEKVQCSFFNNIFMIAISTKRNFFELGGLFKPLNNPENIKNFINELNSIYAMIDHFKLDEKTGL